MEQGPIRPLPQSGTRAGGGFSPSRPAVHGPAQGVFKRVVLLCLRPESWADMARYPLRYTFWTVLVAVILASLLTAIAAGRNFTTELDAFANRYDARFAPLSYVDGKLTASANTPVEKLPKFEAAHIQWVIDPTGQTKIEDMPEGSALMTSDSVLIKGGFGVVHADFYYEMIREFLKSAGVTHDINGTALKTMTDTYGTAMGIVFGMGAMAGATFSNILWAVIIAFLVSPLVRIAAPNLRMPRNMPYRISGAITVPLLVLGGVLDLAGHSPANVFGVEGATLFWFFTAAALALWGGYLLNRHAIEALKRTRGH